MKHCSLDVVLNSVPLGMTMEDYYWVSAEIQHFVVIEWCILHSLIVHIITGNYNKAVISEGLRLHGQIYFSAFKFHWGICWNDSSWASLDFTKKGGVRRS